MNFRNDSKMRIPSNQPQTVCGWLGFGHCWLCVYSRCLKREDPDSWDRLWGAKNRSMDSADAGSDPWRGKLLAPYMSTEKCQMDGPHRNVKWIWRQLFFMVKECAVFFFIFGDVYGDNIRDPVANVGLIGSFFLQAFQGPKGCAISSTCKPSAQVERVSARKCGQTLIAQLDTKLSKVF